MPNPGQHACPCILHRRRLGETIESIHFDLESIHFDVELFNVDVDEYAHEYARE